VSLQDDLRRGGRLVGIVDAGEAGHRAGTGLLVVPLRIAALGDGDGHIDEDLEEGHAELLVAGPHRGAVTHIGADETGDDDHIRVGQQEAGLARPPHILGPFFGGEAKPTVQAMAQVVAINPVGEHPPVHHAPLDEHADGALPGRGESGHPDREAAVLENPLPIGPLDETMTPNDVVRIRHARHDTSPAPAAPDWRPIGAPSSLSLLRRMASHDPHHRPTAAGELSQHSSISQAGSAQAIARQLANERMGHLDLLEAEAIHIMRETVAGFDRPVMLYSVGKDSTVMLHLARKAFFPGRPPFPVLHIDTGWKFKEMYAYRDRYVRDELGIQLLVHRNEDGVRDGVNPITHGSRVHTDIMKTVALRQALDLHRFDAAFGGARRDEEKSRAKERIFSVRDPQHRWDPRMQRPELWNTYNTRIRTTALNSPERGESVRVFPLSNWTELDVWLYVRRENLPVVPLYFAKERPVVERHGTLIMLDDQRLPLKEGEQPTMKKVRFRTLGCYPLTGAVESDAETLDEVILELIASRFSERQGRIIDHDGSGSMEDKKREGYF
jgi:sulfate adenylyltransferase subunit 2